MSQIQKPTHGSALEVFLVFLRLGCISFGGPVAHLAYFQKELVVAREWCDQDSFAEVIALAQSLPGPSSSQVCFAMGIMRAGWFGGIAAWTAFTLPSALLMLALAFGTPLLSGSIGSRVVHGLQLVAVAIVGQAVLTMQRSLAPDKERMALAIAALGIVLFGGPQFATLFAISVGCIAGLVMFHSMEMPERKAVLIGYSKRWGVFCALLFFALLFLLPMRAHLSRGIVVSAASAFYRSGALVFGGGHVVLPLLESAVVAPGWVKQSIFLTGYGAAQVLPGPLFAFGGFLGASIQGAFPRLALGLIGLVSLSAPGLLAMGAVLPFWANMGQVRFIQSGLRGVNAAVVGILIAALFTPLWTSSIHNSLDFFLSLTAFVLLVRYKQQPWIVGVVISVASMLSSNVSNN